MTTENKWYMYENDIYGVNALTDFPSKEALVEYILSPDYLESRISEEIDEAGKVDLKDACDRYMSNELNAFDFGEEVLMGLSDYDCEIEMMIIEDFQSLRTGKTEFSQECIEVYCDEAGIDSKTIPDDHVEGFQKYFDDAHDNWIG